MGAPIRKEQSAKLDWERGRTGLCLIVLRGHGIGVDCFTSAHWHPKQKAPIKGAPTSETRRWMAVLRISRGAYHGDALGTSQ